LEALDQGEDGRDGVKVFTLAVMAWLGTRSDLPLLEAESYLEIPYRLGVNLVETTICGGRVAAL
jgi:hypothetical protein